MDKNIWTLVAFTLLTQTGVGIFLVHGLSILTSPPWNQEQAFPHSRKLLLLVLFLLAVALALSFLHLGYPLHFLHAVNHIGRSWLSREVLALSIFFLVVFVLFLTGKTGLEGLTYRRWFTAAGMLAGLFLLYAMSGVYMIKTIPSWDSWYTPFSFFATALLTGALAFMLSYLLFFRHDPFLADATSLLPGMRTLAGFAAAVLVLVIAAFLVRGRAFDHHAMLSLIRLLSSSLACVMLVLMVIPGVLNTGFPFIVRWSWISFILVCTGEVAGRVMFFLSFERTGV